MITSRVLVSTLLLLASLHAMERQPVALTYLEPTHELVTANRGTGTLSIINAKSFAIKGELKIGGTPSDVAAVRGTNLVLVTDESEDTLILLSDGEVKQRLAVPDSPVRVQIDSDGKLATVTSRWARCVSVIAIDREARKMEVSAVIPLTFSPMEQCLLADDRGLLVADAYGGKLALIGLAQGEVLSVRGIPAHNIRGLAIDPTGESLLITHQRLHAVAQTTIGDIHWGNLMGSHVRTLSMKRVIDPLEKLLEDSSLEELGKPDEGAGDPTAIAFTASGDRFICLSGVHQMQVTRPGKEPYKTNVGMGPMDVLPIPKTERVIVANRFSDSLSVINAEGEVEHEIQLSEDGSNEPTAAQRGERLFHNANLSLDGWLSCQSCHTNGHSNGLLADTLSDGAYGNPKRVISLLGVGDTGPWAWDGSVSTLEDQVERSVAKTMRGSRKLTEPESSDLAAYLRTLKPPESAVPPVATADGQAIFRERKCDQCHRPPEFTTPKTYEVSLRDELGNDVFNPPSLQGVRHRPNLFHDGRATGLTGVFESGHQLETPLTETETEDLMGYLLSL